MFFLTPLYTLLQGDWTFHKHILKKAAVRCSLTRGSLFVSDTLKWQGFVFVIGKYAAGIFCISKKCYILVLFCSIIHATVLFPI